MTINDPTSATREYGRAVTKRGLQERGRILDELAKGDLMTVDELAYALLMTPKRVQDHLADLNRRQKVSYLKITRKSEGYWTTYHPYLDAKPLPEDVVATIKASRGLA